MNIQDYSPRLAISVQREIIENQRTTIEYWRGQVADRDERIKALEAALAKSDPWNTVRGEGWNGMVKHKFVCLHCGREYDPLNTSTDLREYHNSDCIWSLAAQKGGGNG